jgi:hypothetical protein
MDLVPHDATGFVTVRSKDIWNDDTVKEFLKLATGPIAGAALSNIEKATGVDLKQIDRITAILPSTLAPGDSPIGIVTTSKPFDKKKVKTALVPTGTEKKTDSGKVYYEDSQRNAAVHFVGENTLIASSPKMLAAYLGKKLKPGKQSRLKGSRQLVEKHTMVAIVDFADWGSDFTKALPNWEGRASLTKAKSAVLTITADKESAANLSFSFTDEGAAKSAEKDADTVRDHLADQLAATTKDVQKRATNPNVKNDEFNSFAQGQALKLLQALLDGVKKAEITRKNQEVQVSCRAKISAGQAVLGVLFLYMPTSVSPQEK